MKSGIAFNILANARIILIFTFGASQSEHPRCVCVWQMSGEVQLGHSAGADSQSAYIKPRDFKRPAEAVFPALDEWLPKVFKYLS